MWSEGKGVIALGRSAKESREVGTKRDKQMTDRLTYWQREGETKGGRASRRIGKEIRSIDEIRGDRNRERRRAGARDEVGGG